MYSLGFLGTLKEDLGKCFQTKEALKMVFGVCSIRLLSQFLLDLGLGNGTIVSDYRDSCQLSQ